MTTRHHATAGIPGDRTSLTGRPTRPMRAWLRRALGICLGLVLSVSVLAAAGWFWAAHIVTSYGGPHFNRGQNAVWLEHTWAGDPHSAYEYDVLVARLKREQIGYVFVHVGPLNSDGTISEIRFKYAATLVTELKRRDSALRILAWIGQLERASGFPADQTVDLANASTRQSVAVTSAYFCRVLAFDGVHYDIEPMLNNNPRLLDLLDVTRAQLPAGKLISISAPMWAPNAHAADWLRSTVGEGAGLWTTYYYAAVAKHVDQMVVMDYNTALPAGPLYRLFVKQQTQNILAAVRSAHQPPQVLIGLPTYQGNGFWFHDAAENVAQGIPGVVAGLNSDRDTEPFAGIALYRFGTTSASDWRAYERLWLGE